MKQTKYFLLSIYLGLITVSAGAQESVYSFLDLPVSSRQAALGGKNVSIADRDINFAFQNPALLNKDGNKVVAFNMSNIIGDIKFGTAIFGLNTNLGNWAVGVQYLDYGKFAGRDEFNQDLGGFEARDMALNIIYSRQLAKNLMIGATLKPVFSSFETYTSYGVGVDLGLSYEQEQKLFSAGLSVKNLGSQLKDYSTDEFGQMLSPMPLDIQLGLTKKLSHAPFRFSVTLHHLNKWNLNYVSNLNAMLDVDMMDIQSTSTSLDMAFRHFVGGLEFLPGKNFYLAASYDHRRHQELKMIGFKSMAGFAFGGGIKLKMFHVGFSASQMQLGNVNYQFSLSTGLDDFTL